ncbi:MULTISPECIES: protein kinase domain-containing protein [unclassified Coleofasciculus]|uniref:serine/threonine-protein kinase n=1 Tax=unclassified Coleofasciculus TaxID=2692782 RepID=UPI00187E5BC7|nr:MULTISPECIES: serine/threonine-protein kinase [unclassified Coleofasciculus]MBE9126940.1 tetratricopeptide repeat protein [Coleofasciculus sp. LEGE 07081]MBE9148649.1 tetratricopeptide repeat protein [Coleofasciculus sp. LEGE 07092]
MVSVSQTPWGDKPLGGRYQVRERLGEGGFGQTFLALDLHLPGNPPCAIKQLKPQANDTESLQTARRLFDTEAQVLYQLGDHDQIPRLLAHFEEDQEFYLAQEFIEGKLLSEELASRQYWSEVQVVALLQDMLHVLTFVHQQNVIHRDIKPSNLIRRKHDGKLVLIDFGAVKQVSTQLIEPEAEQLDVTISIGTKGYMPNEQVAGKPRFSSDVYAVGIICVQALTGIHPKRIQEDPHTSELNWRKHVKVLRPELGDIIDCMVRYDFRDRYPTAAEALLALQNLPTELLESVTLSQLLGTDTLENPSSKSQPSASHPDTVESETEPSSTQPWIRDSHSETSQPTLDGTDTTVSLSQQQQPSSSTTIPTIVIPEESQRRLIKPWIVMGVGVAVGAVAAFMILYPTRQTDDRSEAPSPSPSPTESPKPTATSLLKEAERLREAEDYQEALLFYDRAIALKPDLAEAYRGRCYSFNKLEQPAEAIVACNDALDLNPDDPQALLGKADSIKQQNRQIQALQLYEKVTRLDPNLAAGWIRFGIALQDVGRSSEAIDALDTGIKLNRNSADAWSTRGEALLNLGRTDEAIPALDKALQIQPNHSKALKLRQKVANGE